MILLSGANYLAVFEADQLHAQVLLFLNAFYDVWAIGLIVFGFHIFILGYLVFKSNYIPRVLGVLLIVAGLSYLIDYFGKFLFPNFIYAILLFAVMLTAASAQRTGWKHSGSVYILTTPEGAHVPASVSEKDFPVLVRTISCEKSVVRRVLDLGPCGILLPSVESTDELDQVQRD